MLRYGTQNAAPFFPLDLEDGTRDTGEVGETFLDRLCRHLSPSLLNSSGTSSKEMFERLDSIALNRKIGAWDSSKEMTHFCNCEKAFPYWPIGYLQSDENVRYNVSTPLK
jgi:hypothetical protein